MEEINQEIWFIINFFSGTIQNEKKRVIVEEINKYPYTVIFETQYPKHAAELAQKAIEAGVKRVVAIGGDGTLNEVGSILRGSDVLMGIVPIGSGNGLARHLKIPLNPIMAIKKALLGNGFLIDTCTINEIPFFCTAGVGFDAQVAFDFSKKKSRGFITYIITSIQSFFVYKVAEYQVFVEEKNINVNAFAITFANASQYGNDAVVAPDSKIDDGLIDLVILRKFPIFASIFIAFRLFSDSFSRSKYVTTIKGTAFKIKAAGNLIIHFDGEPMQLNTNELIVKIDDKKLKVIV